MAEEFADLTNSRINDSRYANNIVFDKDGLSELLQHIKNYPIINIEAISETDKDELHPNKKVWDTYTDGSPCIKVTFGDEENKTGNLTSEQVEILKGYQKNLELYSGVQAIYNKYASVESEYKGLIRNLRDELQQVINNVYAVYQTYISSDKTGNSLTDPNINWTGKYYNLLLKPDGTLTKSFRQNSPLVVDKFYYKITFEIADFTNEATLNSFIINNNNITDISFYDVKYEHFDSTQDRVNDGTCIVPFKGYDQSHTPENINWEVDTDVNIIRDDEDFDYLNAQTQFRHFNDLLIRTLQMLSNDYVQVQRGANFDSNITYYIYNNNYYQKVEITEFDSNQNYYYKAGNDNNHIRNLIRQYIDYIRESRVNRYEEIRKFLIQNEKTEPILLTPVTSFDTNPNSNYQKVSSYIDSQYRKGIQEIQTNIDNLLNNAYDLMGADKQIKGYKYIKVGSNIKFKNIDKNDVQPLTNEDTAWQTGTFRVKIDSKIYEVPIMGLAGGTGAVKLSGHLLPDETGIYDIGGDRDSNSKLKWRNLYLSNSLGDSNNYIPNAYIDTGYFNNLYIDGRSLAPTMLPTTTSDTAHFWRGNGEWSDTLTGRLILSTAVNGYKHTDTTKPTASNALFRANGNGYFDGNLSANKVFNAVFNDYAECRTTIDLSPGHVVVDNDDGTLSCSSKRLQPGAQVISDTFGHSMGETEFAKTHIAVAGRVLAYTYQPRENYHAGMAVCSAPNGTIDIMTREEIKEYPDCIIGIVSEIPNYEYWGTDNIKVDNRIWIKVK